MTALETARLVAEILAIIGMIGGGFYALARLLWRVLDRIEVLQQTTESVKTKQEQMNGSVAAHFELEELSRRQ